MNIKCIAGASLGVLISPSHASAAQILALPKRLADFASLSQ